MLVGRQHRPLSRPRQDWRRRNGPGLSSPRLEAQSRRRAEGPAGRFQRDPIGWRASSARRSSLASLNHPEHRAIYGVEESDGVTRS